MKPLHHHQIYLIEEFAEAYLERRLDRRELVRRVLYLTGSVAGAATVLFSLGCGDSVDDTPAATGTTAPLPTTAAGTPPGVPEADPAIQAASLRFPGSAGYEVLGYLARPRASGAYPGVIVIHENRGLVEHTKDVARRYAKEGFAALAVDLVSRLGGTSSADMTRTMTALRASRDEMVADLTAGVNYLKQHAAFVKPTAIGVTGFCFGGTQTWELAIANADLKAAVPYYGSVGSLDRLGEIKAAVLAIYAGNDTRITAQAPEVEQRLRAAGRTVETKVYPGVNHAFFNDTGASYNADAAADAWKTTLAWFRKYLTG
jgi:carboxymethylenebutenolidase